MIENDMMIRIAWMYYFENKTQNEISNLLKISRQKVQRLINKAKEEGIVQVKISNSAHNLLSLEGDLRNKFDIEDAVVVPSNEVGEELRKSLAKGAANYLGSFLENISSLGIGMGMTLSHLPGFIDPSLKLKKEFRIISLLGNLLKNYSSNPLSIGIKFAEKFKVPYYGLWVPYKLDTMEAAETVKSQEAISEVLEMIKKVDISVVGIGGTINRNPRSGIVNDEEMRTLNELGAVGDILGRWFDKNGNFVFEELNRRIIGAHVKTPGKTIGVAGGLDKAGAIKGALVGKLVDILIVDEKTARHILSN